MVSTTATLKPSVRVRAWARSSPRRTKPGLGGCIVSLEGRSATNRTDDARGVSPFSSTVMVVCRVSVEVMELVIPHRPPRRRLK